MTMRDVGEEAWTDRETEAYVQALWDLMLAIGFDGHSKTYDPLTIEREEGKEPVVRSYVFSYAIGGPTGGRAHPLTSLEAIRVAVLKEVASDIARRGFVAPDYS